MITLAAKQIVMGRHSNLGPIDPQIGGRPAIAILKEFERARNDIVQNPALAMLWQPILQHYLPTLLSHAEHSIQWAQDIGKKTLVDGMLKDVPDANAKAEAIVDFLISHDVHKAHGRHLHRSELRAKGLQILDLEDDPKLQDAVLSVHHAAMLTVSNFGASKLIENHNGISHIKMTTQVQVQMPIQVPAGVPSTPTAPVPAPAPGQAPASPTAPTPNISLLQRIKLAIKLIFGRF
jgi:hypothetical protein